MREIKFRVWDKEDNRMIVHEQDFIPLKICSLGVLRLSPNYENSMYELMDANRFEIMQFTGLFDKQGKEIYEGDILKGFYNPNELFIGKVSIELGNTIITFKDKIISCEAYMELSEFIKTENIIELEIIGNKFENLNY